MTDTQNYSIRQPEVVGELIDGEAVIINLETGSYYSMTDVGSFVWSQLEIGRSVDEIIAATVANYACEEAVIAASVRRLLAELEAEELITAIAAAPTSGASQPLPTAQTRLPFHEPVLEKYTDMAQLLLLDPIHEVDATGWPVVAPDPRADSNH